MRKIGKSGTDHVFASRNRELTQWTMPRNVVGSQFSPMDGLEAARRIRALEGGREVKIAAITASVFREERDQVMAAGMDDFVRKPFREEEIFD